MDYLVVEAGDPVPDGWPRDRLAVVTRGCSVFCVPTVLGASDQDAFVVLAMPGPVARARRALATFRATDVVLWCGRDAFVFGRRAAMLCCCGGEDGSSPGPRRAAPGQLPMGSAAWRVVS